MSNQSYYSTLVLSGGAMLILTTLGALHYCHEQKLTDHIDTYIGTSAGAIISYLLAIGYTPMECSLYMCTNDFIPLSHFNVPTMLNCQGALPFTRIQEHLETLTLDKIGQFITFGELYSRFKNTLVISVYNWTMRRIEYLSRYNHPEMPILVALKKSCSLPILFPPFKYNDYYYIDAGVIENFPIGYTPDDDSFEETHRLGININLNSAESTNEPPHTHNFIEYVYKLITMPITEKEIDTKGADVIHLNTDHTIYHFELDTKQKMDMFSKGYTQAKLFFEE